MRALQTLLIALGLGSVAAAAADAGAEQPGPAAWEIALDAADDADAAADDAVSRVSMFEPWPDLTVPAPPADAEARAYALFGEPDVPLPLFLDEVGGPATGPSVDAVAGGANDGAEGGGAGGGGSLFDKGTWALQLTGSYYRTVAGNEVTLAYGTVNLGYYYADTWAIDMHVSGYALEEDGESEGVAASLGLNLRKHFWIRDPYSVYIDGGMGMFRADGEFPDGGTHTNFTLQAGLGATYRLTESLHLVGGARWFHISNARRHGEDENESTDGVAVYGGVMWTW